MLQMAFLSVVIYHLQLTHSLQVSCTHTVVEDGIKFESVGNMVWSMLDQPDNLLLMSLI